LKYRFLFTISAGRTGTEWLAGLLAANLGVPAIHEPLEIDDFGLRMPDIKIMRSFNDRGNTALVRSFFEAKFSGLTTSPAYVETNHTLAKCGLVENLVALGLGRETGLILLRRDLYRQCLSYLLRRDFTNVTIVWQWYLHHAYRNNIVDTAPFVFLEDMGQAVWYAHEMRAREIYYQRLFSQHVDIIACDLDSLNTRPGAAALLGRLGSVAEPQLPPAANQNPHRDSEGHAQRLGDGLAALRCDVEAMVSDYIARGRRLDVPPAG
jgi:hypothetical protein